MRSNTSIFSAGDKVCITHRAATDRHGIRGHNTIHSTAVRKTSLPEFTKNASTSLAKQPLIFNGGLAKL